MLERKREYLGRLIDTRFFRVFIYNAAGDSMLVNSWDEFQEKMSSGLWFAQPVHELKNSASEMEFSQDAEMEEGVRDDLIVTKSRKTKKKK